MYSCKNCGSTNEPGATRCRVCRIPGDFGQAPQPEAKVVAPQLVDCGNCARQAPVTALHCPSCRWPLQNVSLPREPRIATDPGSEKQESKGLLSLLRRSA